MYIKEMIIDNTIEELDQINDCVTLVISHIDIDEIHMIMDESSINDMIQSISEDTCGVDTPHRWYIVTFKDKKFNIVQLLDHMLTCKEEDDSRVPSFKACPRELQMCRQILVGDES